MPRVGDYSKCKIYKITSLNNPELVYYGHTCQTLARRFTSHKASTNTSTSKIIIEKGDAVILLIEDYPCQSKDQATSREAFYVLNNPCVNKCIPGRTTIQYYELHKEEISEYKKQYNKLHKDEISEYKKQYNESHKEKISEINKKYRGSHKEEISETNKKYREENREKILEKKRQYYLKKKLEKLETLNI